MGPSVRIVSPYRTELRQEGAAVYESLGGRAKDITWHMIGHLQTNKINKALRLFDVVQTVDSLQKAIAIDKRVSGRH